VPWPSYSCHGLVSSCLGRVTRALAWFPRDHSAMAWFPRDHSAMAWFPRALAELLVPWLGFLVTGRDHRAMAWFPRALAELLVPWLGFLVPWPSYSCLGLVSS
jgi:hypothetical protein